MNNAHNHIPLLAEPDSILDELLALWARTTEVERVAFPEVCTWRNPLCNV